LNWRIGFTIILQEAVFFKREEVYIKIDFERRNSSNSRSSLYCRPPGIVRVVVFKAYPGLYTVGRKKGGSNNDPRCNFRESAQIMS